MNRQQRRQQQRKLNEPILNLKRSDCKVVVDEMVQKEMQKINADNLDIFLHLLCVAGEAEFNFKRGRLLKLVDRISKQYESIMMGYCSKEDVKQYVRDELKIDLQIRR